MMIKVPAPEPLSFNTVSRKPLNQLHSASNMFYSIHNCSMAIRAPPPISGAQVVDPAVPSFYAAPCFIAGIIDPFAYDHR